MNMIIVDFTGFSRGKDDNGKYPVNGKSCEARNMLSIVGWRKI